MNWKSRKLLSYLINRVSSSFIAKLDYDVDAEAVDVEMKRGSIYRYEDIGEDEYQSFLKAKSKGVYYNANIRNDKQWERIA